MNPNSSPHFRSLIALALLVPGSALGDVSLTDGATQVLIDPNSSAGLHQWWVPPVQAAQQNWYWYRIGNNPEAPINTISAATVSQTPNSADISFANSQLAIDLTYNLLGGGITTPYIADLEQEIDVQNLSGAPLDFHLFELGHFHSSGIPYDTAQVTTSFDGTVQIQQQSIGTSFANITLGSSPVTAWDVDSFPGVLQLLTNNVPDVLDGNMTVASPGDVAWGMEWDLTLSTNDVFSAYNESLESAGMPEPSVAAFALLATSLAWWSNRKVRNSDTIIRPTRLPCR